MAGAKRWWAVFVALGRVAAAMALAVAVTLVAPPVAHACSCAPTTPRDSSERADVILFGTVREVETVRRPAPKHQKFTVDVAGVYKGEAYAEQIVVSPDTSGSCGITPSPGTSIVIFAGYADREPTDAPELFTTLCFGNQVQNEPPTELGNPIPPQPGRSADVGRAGRIDDMVSRGLMITGLSVLGIIALAGVSLAVLWRPGRPAS